MIIVKMLIWFPWNFRKIIPIYKASTKIWTILIVLNVRIGLGS